MIKLNINDINYNEGIRKDNNNHYIFDKETDKVTDFLYLNPSINGVKTEDGLPYYFAYFKKICCLVCIISSTIIGLPLTGAMI